MFSRFRVGFYVFLVGRFYVSFFVGVYLGLLFVLDVGVEFVVFFEEEEKLILFW